jgi:uncharacterized protein YdaU (DUF1376 family)
MGALASQCNAAGVHPRYPRNSQKVRHLNFYKHHLGDYDGATAHLSWDEDMAYTRLLRTYYRREKPFTDRSEAYRLTRATSKAQRSAVDTVLDEFFTQESDGFRNKRADQEIEAYQNQCENNRRVGKQGGRPKKTEVVSENNQSGFVSVPENNPNHKPLTKNQYKPRFAEFWLAYPNKKAKGDAEKAWNALRPDDSLTDQILRAVESAKTGEAWLKDGGQFIPYPATWLRAKRWLDGDSAPQIKYAEGCEGLAL